MYSVLLAAMLSGAGAAPDWGWYDYAWGGGFYPSYYPVAYYPGYGYAGYYYPVYYTPWSYYVYPYYVWPYWPSTRSSYVAAYPPTETLAPAGGTRSAVASAVAHINVRLPADGRLLVDDVLCPRPGPGVSFDTPALEPGRTYQYSVKAEVVRDGRTYTKSRRVTFGAGRTVSLDFSDLVPGRPAAGGETFPPRPGVTMPSPFGDEPRGADTARPPVGGEGRGENKARPAEVEPLPPRGNKAPPATKPAPPGGRDTRPPAGEERVRPPSNPGAAPPAGDKAPAPTDTGKAPPKKNPPPPPAKEAPPDK